MLRKVLAFAALLLAALSLAPSFAHLLEAEPWLVAWPPELWLQATVFHRQFIWFAWIGGPIDVAAILAAGAFAFCVRRTPARIEAAAGAGFLALGLVAWAVIVAGANATLAAWRPGPPPADFASVRLRWEAGHMIVAVAKLVGLACVIGAVVRQTRLDDGSAATGDV